MIIYVHYGFNQFVVSEKVKIFGYLWSRESQQWHLEDFIFFFIKIDL